MNKLNLQRLPNRERLKQDIKEVIQSLHYKSLILLLIFPTILTIFFLFSNLNSYLSLNIYNPSWWQIVTSHFVHRDFNHFINNTSLFLLLGVIQLVIISGIKEEKNYFLLLLLLIAFFPLIGSLVEIILYPKIIPFLKNSMGASGIVSAVWGTGYMLFLFALSKDRWLLNVHALNISLIYVGLLFLIRYYPYHKSLGIVLILGIALLFLLYLYRAEIKFVGYEVAKASQQNLVYTFSLILALLMFIAGSTVLFPIKLMDGNGMIDFFMHYMGIIFGLTFSFIYLNVFHKKKPLTQPSEVLSRQTRILLPKPQVLFPLPLKAPRRPACRESCV